MAADLVDTVIFRALPKGSHSVPYKDLSTLATELYRLWMVWTEDKEPAEPAIEVGKLFNVAPATPPMRPAGRERSFTVRDLQKSNKVPVLNIPTKTTSGPYWEYGWVYGADALMTGDSPKNFHFLVATDVEAAQG